MYAKSNKKRNENGPASMAASRIASNSVIHSTRLPHLEASRAQEISESAHISSRTGLGNFLQRKSASGDDNQIQTRNRTPFLNAASSYGRAQEIPEADISYDRIRQYYCIDEPDPHQPTRKEHFKEDESRYISVSLWGARSTTSRALMNLGHRDPYHATLARRVFGREVSLEILIDRVQRIYEKLNSLSLSSSTIVPGTCHDTTCNRNAPAYTSNDLSTVVLCPFFFTLFPNNPSQGIRTFIHEAGHMANIDTNWAPGNETYCHPDGAIHHDDPCPTPGDRLLNVDAWMVFISLVSHS